MFYKAAGSASGLYELGSAISGGGNISKLSGQITISRADQGGADGCNKRKIRLYVAAVKILSFAVNAVSLVNAQTVQRADLMKTCIREFVDVVITI